MAERVVIAELDFDDSGIVKTVGDTNASMGRLEGQTTRTASVFTNRMFNMRTAAMAFLGSFTLAGVIFSLKHFAEELVKSASGFALFSEQASKASTSFMAWLVDILHVNQGLDSLTQWMDRFMLLGNRLAALADNPLIKGIGAVNAFLFGFTPVGLTLKAIEKAGELIDKVTGRQDVRPIEKAVKVPEDFWGNQPLKTAVVVDDMAHSLFVAMELAHGLGDAFRFADDAVEELNADVNVLVRPSMWQNFKTAITDMAKEFEVAASIIDVAVGAFSSALTEWAEGGTLTMRKFFSSMLVMIGQTLLAWGALAIIKGYFTYDGALIAAGFVAIGAGIAAFAAARAIGGSSGASAGQPSGSSALGFGGAAGTSQTINLTIEGNVDSESRIRDIVTAVSRALKDGASGGNFDGQLARA